MPHDLKSYTEQIGLLETCIFVALRNGNVGQLTDKPMRPAGMHMSSRYKEVFCDWRGPIEWDWRTIE